MFTEIFANDPIEIDGNGLEAVYSEIRSLISSGMSFMEAYETMMEDNKLPARIWDAFVDHVYTIYQEHGEEMGDDLDDEIVDHLEYLCS